MDNHNTIFDIKYLDKNYSNTRITVPIELEQTNCDIGRNTKAFFDIDLDHPLHFNNVYIAKTRCKKIILKKITSANLDQKCNSAWKITIYIEKILSWENCNLLVENCLSFLSYCLAKDNISNADGIPVFSFNFMHMKVEFAKEDKIFDTSHLCTKGIVSSTSMISHSDNPLFFKETPFSLDDINYFIEAVSTPDIRAKYLLLYKFIETYIPSNTKRKDKNKTIYQQLQNDGVTTFTSGLQKQYQLKPEDVTNLVSVRNDIAHNRKSKKLFSTLYDILFPLVIEIINKGLL